MAHNPTTYVGCLCVHDVDLHSVAVAVLERYHVAFVRHERDDNIWYEVPAITAQQYDAVIESLSDLGEPGDDWDLTLD